MSLLWWIAYISHAFSAPIHPLTKCLLISGTTLFSVVMWASLKYLHATLCHKKQTKAAYTFFTLKNVTIVLFSPFLRDRPWCLTSLYSQGFVPYCITASIQTDRDSVWIDSWGIQPQRTVTLRLCLENSYTEEVFYSSSLTWPTYLNEYFHVLWCMLICRDANNCLCFSVFHSHNVFVLKCKAVDSLCRWQQCSQLPSPTGSSNYFSYTCSKLQPLVSVRARSL